MNAVAALKRQLQGKILTVMGVPPEVVGLPTTVELPEGRGYLFLPPSTAPQVVAEIKRQFGEPQSPGGLKGSPGSSEVVPGS